VKMGELFAGYGGLGLAVQTVLPDAQLAWVSEIDPGANKILEHRFPGVLNIGDITTVDWSRVEPVDILTGGTPCQDLSHAGKRAGMTEGTRSNLWVAMREAIATLKPRLVVWENVGGAASAEADSEVEPCPGCVGDGSRVSLRALGRVVGDLSSLGYVGRVRSLRAADVGGPHGRLRYFLVAYPAGHPNIPGLEGRFSGVGGAGERVAGPAGGEPALLPTPAAYDGERGGPQHPDKRRDGGHSVSLQDAVHGMVLLPTPVTNDMGEGKTPDVWDEWTAKMQAAHGNGNGHGKSLAIEAQRLLPTPRAARGASGTETMYAFGGERTDEHRPQGEVALNWTDWGVYADAITRWETLTRPAPPPTQPSKKGTPQLSPRFSEWMMGLPDGWVTGVPGVTRNEALKAIGNGVCPQQAAAALRFLLGADTTPLMRATVGLLPSPSASDGNGGRQRSQASLEAANHQANLTDIHRLLPTPRASDGEKGGPNQRGSSGDLMLPSAVMNLTGDAHV
jgi:DNA (cytosine-5)-methyltransferase 1